MIGCATSTGEVLVPGTYPRNPLDKNPHLHQNSVHTHSFTVTLKTTCTGRSPSSEPACPPCPNSYLDGPQQCSPSSQLPCPAFTHQQQTLKVRSLLPSVQLLEAVLGRTPAPFSHPQWPSWSAALKPLLIHFFSFYTTNGGSCSPCLESMRPWQPGNQETNTHISERWRSALLGKVLA